MVGRIAVLGAGGMGSAFAAFLARAGADVVLVGRGGAHVRAVAERGLLVAPPGEDAWRVDVPVAVTAADLPHGSVDVLVVLTKTYDSAAAVAGAAPALSPAGVAVSLQNGLGNDAVLAGAVGGRRALVGVTTVGATVQSPGAISITGSTAARRSLTHVGATGQARAEDRADDVVAALEAAGLPALHARPVDVAVWEKLALAVMSPVSSVLRATVATVWRHPEGRALVERMFDEVVAVGRAQGVDLDRDAAWAHAARVFDGTGEHHTSMCSDVMAGRRTELSAMAGAVAGLAVRDGVPVPVHTTVLAMLHVMGA
ncbi:2-dehydropantoate 2-reductase [Geodermatophilus sabuli]|uniref:2-dehydropantoate 2-reductase n=1 Tax=Geodermatophilus sabuli TaxID=1564158 RepID=A0A7K3W0T0_9ACTN|nr:2-dehydropantoate 2-reductase [Geodermatophilus sabuli]